MFLCILDLCCVLVPFLMQCSCLTSNNKYLLVLTCTLSLGGLVSFENFSGISEIVSPSNMKVLIF